MTNNGLFSFVLNFLKKFKSYLFNFSEIPSDSESFWALRFKTALAQMKDLTCDEKVSDRTDSDSTVLFDPAKSAPEVVHAAETPESSDLPAATDVEEHLTSLSHSILETSLGRKLLYLYTHLVACFSCSHLVVLI